jgi:AcrR family transcriptional regulator
MSRRSSDEIQALILSAARELFAARGYSGTSTRDLADRAGVAESVLYRKYNTKAALFEEAVAQPFRELLEAYATRWEKRAAHERRPEVLARDYVESLFDFLTSHRELGLALVNVYSFESEIAEQIGSVLSSALDRIERIGWQQAEDLDLPGLDIGVTIRVVAGMVFSQALFKGLFFPDRPRVSKARIVDEMVNVMIYGETGRPRTLDGERRPLGR